MKAIIIQGSTGVGKSDIAYELAKMLNTELISADSRQVYKGANIGTNKTTFEDIKTYLIDTIYPDEQYSAFTFLNDAKKIIKEKYADKKIPVIVGGTAFYIDILTGRQKLYKSDKNFEQILKSTKEKYSNFSNKELSYELSRIDPIKFSNLNESEKLNGQRLIRRLGESIYKIGFGGEAMKQVEALKGYEFIKIGILPPQDYDEILNDRANNMMQKGLRHEVEEIYEKYSFNVPVLNTIGYKEFFDDQQKLKPIYKDVNEILPLIINHTRQYAKRQMTWLKRDSDILWYKKRDDLSDKVISEVIKNLDC